MVRPKSTYRRRRGALLPAACEAAERAVILRRDNGVDPGEALVLGRHLRRCSRCRRISRLFDGLLAAIRNEPIPEPDDTFWERMRRQIMARIRAEALTPAPAAHVRTGVSSCHLQRRGTR